MSPISMRSWCSRLAMVTVGAFGALLLQTQPIRADILVSDFGNSSVLKYTDAGVLIPPTPFINNVGGGGGTEGIACLTVGGQSVFFIANNSAQIGVYDQSSGTLLRNFTDPSSSGQVTAISLSLDGTRLYAADGIGIVEFDTSSGAVVHSETTQSVHDLIVGPDGSVYATFFKNHIGVVRYSPDLSSFTTFIADGDHGLTRDAGMLFDAAGTHFFVSHFLIGGAAFVNEYNVSGTSVSFDQTFTFPNGSAPLGLALGPDGNVYTANFGTAGVVNSTIGVIYLSGSAINTVGPPFITLPNSPNTAQAKYLFFSEIGCQTAANAFLEICKSSSLTNPVTGNFTFTATNGTFTSAPIVVPVGFCSGPIPVPSGTVTVTEGATPGVGVSAIDAYGFNATTSLEENRLVSSALTPRTVMVNVPAGGIATETVVEYTNSKIPTGVLEVCKDAAPGTTVSGSFSFNVSGASNNPYIVPVGACSGPILVQAGSVTVTEAPRAGFSLVDVTTNPVGRLASLNIPSGSAVVNVAAGDVTAETVVRFVNSPASTETGQLKICKVAGVGVVEGQTFTFTAGGVTYTVPAGPAATGGDCVVDGTFTVGTVVTVAENLQPPYQLLNVTVNPPDRFIDSSGSQIHVTIGTGFTEVTFTNIGSTPTGELKICKVAGPGVAVGTNFAFSVASPPNARRSGGSTQFKTLTVPAGPASAGGYCVVDGTFAVGSTVTVAEIPTLSFTVTGITVNGTAQPSGTTSANVALVGGVTEVAFTNAIGNGGNNPTSLNIMGYEVVSQSIADGAQSSMTYRASLLNTGAPLESLKATLTSLDPSHVQVVPGRDTLNFAPVPANSQVTTSDTFTILTDPAVPFDFSKLKWTLQAKRVLSRRRLR